jgi:4-amino-4-deoxy-L-arabinose transferase-like glycosyltransferase
MDKEKIFIVILFLFAFSLYTISTYGSAIRWWDETIYLNLGQGLSENPLEYNFNGYEDYTPGYTGESAGFRPPLLPYTLAFIYLFTDNHTILFALMPFIGALGVLLVYLLTKELFDKRIAIASAVLFSIFPIYVSFAGKVMNDVYSTVLITAAVLAFWKGFEGNINKYKIAAGVLSALAFLTRYTSGILGFIFLVYILLKRRDILKDKYAYFSGAAFLTTLIPFFIYSHIEYGTMFGAIEHAIKAGTYWGGMQAWTFFFDHAAELFSIIVYVAVIGIIIALQKRDNRNSIILVWLSMVLISVTMLAHKEERFFMAMTPPLAILSAVALSKLGKHFRKGVVVVFLIVLYATTMSLQADYKNSYEIDSINHECFYSTLSYIKENTTEESVIYTGQSPAIFFYTQQETKIVGSELRVEKGSYILWHSQDVTTPMKKEIEEKFRRVYSCPEKNEIYILYRTNN